MPRRICSRYSARSRSARSPRSRDREAALDLDPDVLAVELAVLGEELAVDVGDLAHEDGVGLVRHERQLERSAPREARASPPRPAARTSGSASSVQATPTSSSSSDSSSAGSKPGTSACEHPLAAFDVARPAARRCRSSARAASSRRAGRARSVGLRPTMPQQAAGIRIEPAESVPSAASARPAASAAAEPPLEPPATRPGRAGSARRRSAGSRRSCRRRTRAGSPCRRSRSPAASSSCTASAVRSGTWSAKTAEP